jgi:hypothetical protein
MKYLSHLSVVAAVLSVVTLAGSGVASAYGGGAFIGGVTVVTPTPTPTPAEEEQEILGASTQLPVTGVDGGDLAKAALFMSFVLAGGMLVVSDVRRSKPARAARKA